MVAVLIAMAALVAKEGYLSPSSLFLTILTMTFIIGGILHPQEFGCLVHIFVYYATIPSMYLFLVLYSVCNLNDVSWGTRESPKPLRSKQRAENTGNGNENNRMQDKNPSGFSANMVWHRFVSVICRCSPDKHDCEVGTDIDNVKRRLKILERYFQILALTEKQGKHVVNLIHYYFMQDSGAH